MPFEQRAKLVDKYQSKLQKSKSATSGGNSNEILVGSYVSLKSLPIYNSGAVGITVREGLPRIGQLNEHVFMFRDSKSFKFRVKSAESFTDLSQAAAVAGDMPPPPSPDTATAPAPPMPLTGSLKRKKQYSSSNDLSSSPSNFSNEEKKQSKAHDDEEHWPLNEVVFVEDFKASTVLGKVIKIDNDYVLVKMFNASKEGETSMNDPTLLDNSRIFLKAQLQVKKNS